MCMPVASFESDWNWEGPVLMASFCHRLRTSVLTSSDERTSIIAAAKSLGCRKHAISIATICFFNRRRPMCSWLKSQLVLSNQKLGSQHDWRPPMQCRKCNSGEHRGHCLDFSLFWVRRKEFQSKVHTHSMYAFGWHTVRSASKLLRLQYWSDDIKMQVSSTLELSPSQRTMCLLTRTAIISVCSQLRCVAY